MAWHSGMALILFGRIFPVMVIGFLVVTTNAYEFVWSMFFSNLFQCLSMFTCIGIWASQQSSVI